MSDKPKFEIVDRPAIAPRPEETLDRNSGAAAELAKTSKKPSYRETLDAEIESAQREQDERILRADRAGQPVLDEGNRGEEAWHNAMRNRRNETRTETIKREQGKSPNEVDNLRNGNLDGKPRENSPEDLADATRIRGTAEDVQRERATEEASKKPKKEPAPTIPAEPPVKAENGERLADLGNQLDT